LTSAPKLHHPVLRDRTPKRCVSPTALISRITSLVQRDHSADMLLRRAAQLLSDFALFPQVVVMVSAGQPPVVRSAAASGWGNLDAGALAAAVVKATGVDGLSGVLPTEPHEHDCAFIRLGGAALRGIRRVFRSIGVSGPIASVLSVQLSIRGHTLSALLSAPEPRRALTEGERGLLSAAFAMLGTALEFALRNREHGWRLSQVRPAKSICEGAVDALPQIVCVLDSDGTVIRANRAIDTWGLGSGTQPFFGSLHELLHPGCGHAECALESRLNLAMSNCEVGEEQQFEHTDEVLGRELRIKLGLGRGSDVGKSRNGRTNRFAVIEDLTEAHLAGRRAIRLNGELCRTLAQPNEVLSATQDHLRAATSELADTRLELEEMRRRHRLVLEHTNAGLLMVTEGRVSYCNAHFEALLGYAQRELLGAQLQDLLPCGCLTPDVRCGADGEPTSPQEQVCEIKRQDGASLWLRISEVGFHASGQQVRFVTVVNVTDQIVAEQAIRASRRKLQRLSRSLISSQEDERKRVAGELHDGVGQGLTVLKLMLQNLVADQVESAGDAGVAEPLRVCVDKAQEMIEEVRRLSMDLRPAILDSGGILLALSRLTREVGEMKRGLAVHLEIGVQEPEIQGALKIHLFRIAQEALNNVVRHAKARNVWIRLYRSDMGLKLEIQDDGAGFDPRELEAPARGLGLSSMRQRARLHHGVLRITSEPGRGTTLGIIWEGVVASPPCRPELRVRRDQISPLSRA